MASNYSFKTYFGTEFDNQNRVQNKKKSCGCHMLIVHIFYTKYKKTTLC